MINVLIFYRAVTLDKPVFVYVTTLSKHRGLLSSFSELSTSLTVSSEKLVSGPLTLDYLVTVHILFPKVKNELPRSNH